MRTVLPTLIIALVLGVVIAGCEDDKDSASEERSAGGSAQSSPPSPSDEPARAAEAKAALRFAQCVKGANARNDPDCERVPGLSGVGDVAVSPDGRSVYAATSPPAGPSPPSSLAHFARNRRTGELTFVQCFADASQPEPGCIPAPGLGDLEGVALSPDGHSLYAISADVNDAIVWFDRDGDTGRLSFAACLQDRETGTEPLCADVPTLRYLTDVTVSADGRSVYASGANVNGVVHFDRDRETGALAFAACFKSAQPGAGHPKCKHVGRLGGARELALSRDGRSLYVVALDSNVLTRFARNRATGRLRFADCVVGNRRFGGGRVRSKHPARCKKVRAIGSPRGVAISFDGRSVYVLGMETFVAFDRRKGGALSFAQCFSGRPSLAADPSCPRPRHLVRNPGSVAVSHDGRSVYVGANTLMRFRRDPASRRIAFAQCFNRVSSAVCRRAPGVRFPEGIADSLNSRSVYVASPNWEAVVHLRRFGG
jgi:6-phosphogluconolactonase (cycloisomerase 2 family)